MSLRDDVDRLLPGWESWYPSLFHAAEDLGLIRARVCSPSSLMISHRHAKIYSEAVHAFRVQWSAEESEAEAQILTFKKGNGTSRHTIPDGKRRKFVPPVESPEVFFANSEDQTVAPYDADEQRDFDEHATDGSPEDEADNAGFDDASHR